MARKENPNWKKEAFADFFAGTLNRYLFEKMVKEGLMVRQTIAKDVVGRGRNPVEYTLSPKGWNASGRAPFDISVNTKKSDSDESVPAPAAPRKVVEAVPAVPAPILPKIEKPVRTPIPAVLPPVPRLTQEEMDAIESKPSVTKSERAAYFANANWNAQFDRPVTGGHDPEMPAFLDRRNPVWTEWQNRQNANKSN